MIKDNLALTGALTIAINDKVVQKTDNLVVTSGKEWVARMMAGTDTVITRMGIGTGDGNGSKIIAVDGDTALKELTVKHALDGAATVSGAEITYTCTFDTGTGTGPISEAGLFDATEDMLARTAFDVVNKGASDEMTITWKITVS